MLQIDRNVNDLHELHSNYVCVTSFRCSFRRYSTSVSMKTTEISDHFEQ